MADGILRTIFSSLTGAPGDAAAGPAEKTCEEERKQVLHYFKKRTYSPSEVLKNLKQLTEGKCAKDGKTHSDLARIANDENILEVAFPAAEKAVELANNDGDRDASRKFLDELKNFYGSVTFTQDERQKAKLKEGYIILDIDKPLIKTGKKVFTSIKDRFETTLVQLPLTLYLPFGSYKANLAPFEVSKGTEASAILILYKGDEDGKKEEPTDWGLVGVVGGLLLIGAAGVAGLISPREQQRGEVR